MRCDEMRYQKTKQQRTKALWRLTAQRGGKRLKKECRANRAKEIDSIVAAEDVGVGRMHNREKRRRVGARRRRRHGDWPATHTDTERVGGRRKEFVSGRRGANTMVIRYQAWGS